MPSVVLQSIFLPLIGTTLGSACVFFMKKEMTARVQSALLGVASGVMVAASVWSLIIPAVAKSSHLGAISFLPALCGFWAGIALMIIIDVLAPEQPLTADNSKTSMLFFAVTLHNLPEGMAVGAVVASFISGDPEVTGAATVALAAGIAIQNLPEGSIISMPLRAEGKGRLKSFLYGFASGIVEPIGAICTILLASFITPILPYMLSFAAGAMVFVTVKELIPKMSSPAGGNLGAVMFAIGFSLMMTLDIALG